MRIILMRCDEFLIMEIHVPREKRSHESRLTITLGAGQRAMLEAIARRNETTLAFVVRYALKRFAEEHGGDELLLDLNRLR